MLIHVIFENQSHGFIEAARFDELVATYPFAAFRRRGKWIRVGIDPMRSMATDSPPKPKNIERRHSDKALK